MSAAVEASTRSTAPESGVTRPVRLVRVAVLLIVGMAIAFSAPMHEQLSFNLGLVAAGLGGIGVAHLVEWFSLRGGARTPVPLLLGVVALGAALALPFTTAPIGFALVVAAWALISGLLEFIGAAVRPGTRQDATLLGSTGVLLALLVLFVREDQVAIIGFFGAYALLVGVFLGISAFDTRRSSAPAAADAAPVAP
ncbi:hypothetical protein [Leucobacter luti]|uniref:DUF308 domain-containing protein n=1 Tax=Leucobacter luti TaxID=340320 RepID=A0A4Q7U0T1_9MICO|nr:hypothetical protein [Leucobacter luti]MBL3699445.1 hypothetical protein [Leucobacter luti]RZT66955.1 hypothetical protein EV139_1082 [Leucobacter luti]